MATFRFLVFAALLPLLTGVAFATFDLSQLEAKKSKVQAQLHKLKKNYAFLSEATAPINDLHKDFIQHSESALSLIQSINKKLESLDQSNAAIAELKSATLSENKLKTQEEAKTNIEEALRTDQNALNLIDQLLFNLELKLKASPWVISNLSKNVSKIMGGLSPACKTPFWRKSASSSTAAAVDPNVTELLNAAQAGEVDKIKILLDQGTQIDAQDAAGMNAIMSATSGRQTAALKVLLERGARLDLANKKNQTVFSLADESSFDEFEEAVFPYLTSLNKVKPIYDEKEVPLFSKKSSQLDELKEIKKDLSHEPIWVTGLPSLGQTNSPIFIKSMSYGSPPTKISEEQLIQLIAEQLQKLADNKISDELRHLATRYLSAAGAQLTLFGYNRINDSLPEDTHSYQICGLRWIHVDLDQQKITKYMTYREIGINGVKSVPILGKSEINLTSLQSSENALLEFFPLSSETASYSKMVEFFRKQPAVLPIEPSIKKL